ncbi:MAG: hypothetical protein ACI9S8_002607 [Chlamydiales bacterium]|jgi:hypothetical protein
MDFKELVKHNLKKAAQKIAAFFNCELDIMDRSEVKACVDDLMGRVRLNDQIENEGPITKLFFDKLSHHSSEDYDPSVLDQSVTSYLDNSQRFSKEFKHAIKDIGLINDYNTEKKEEFKTAVRNSLLSLSLGTQPGSPGGFTDCYKIKALDGKTEGIFKPSDFNDWSTAHKSILKRMKIITCWLTGLSGSLPLRFQQFIGIFFLHHWKAYG